MITRGLLDTSVFIAMETERPLDVDALPDELAVSVITAAELRAGVLAATKHATKNARLNTLETVMALRPLPVDVQTVTHWADLRVRLAQAGRRINVNDLWIAAIALANSLPVVTQDTDFDPLVDISSLAVVRV